MAVWTSNESTTAVVDDAAIRPFTVEVPQEEIDELRRRMRATRWPDKRRSTTDRRRSSWRGVEARLNALPQFMTEIDGLDIHFAHNGSG